MKSSILILITCLYSFGTVKAQDNVAEIAHAFIAAVKLNDLSKIENRYLDVGAAYAILPKESAGMNAKQKNDTYLKPLYSQFTENFEKIQQQIKTENINPNKIDLISYKMEPLPQTSAAENETEAKAQAMVLYFNYNKKELVLPIAVVEIDERWYILKILNTQGLFK